MCCECQNMLIDDEIKVILASRTLSPDVSLDLSVLLYIESNRRASKVVV
jgi:hypothetical protein